MDALKIDRSFIAAMTTSEVHMAIVTTVISLARTLKLRSVAEGVETDEQARLLGLLGCDEAQGYLYTKPVPPDEVPAMLERLATTPVPLALPRRTAVVRGVHLQKIALTPLEVSARSSREVQRDDIARILAPADRE